MTVEPAREEHTAAYLEVFEHFDAGQRWLVSYHPPDAPPPGTMHGSSAVCVTPDGLVVLVRERDTENLQMPGGRPEPGEGWRATLDREVLEEACARVEEATLLGFARSECVGSAPSWCGPSGEPPCASRSGRRPSR